MKSKWVFPAVAGALTALWVVLSLPRTEDTGGETLPYTTKNAGWPDSFSRWSVSTSTGETVYSTFSVGSLLFDLVTLAVPIAVTWVVLWKLRPPKPDESEAKKRGAMPSPGKGPPQPPPGGRGLPPPRIGRK
jgi:hypothetical protein